MDEYVNIITAASMLSITPYEVRQLGKNGDLSVSNNPESGAEQVTMDSIKGYKQKRARENALRQKRETGRPGLF